MATLKSIFGIHAIFAAKASKKEADMFIRNLVSNTMAELQERGEFTPEKLEEALVKELADFEKMGKKEVA